MAVTTPKTIFYHMPKTGGTWVQHSLLEAVEGAKKLGADVGWRANETGIHISPRYLKNNLFSFTFVRHPLDWYMSYFRFKNTPEPWTKYPDNGNILSKHCAADDPNEFIDNVRRELPYGYYTALVKQFEDVDYVGRQENLYFDLLDALDQAEQEYDESKILNQHINVSYKRGEEFTKKNREWIEEVESYVIQKYYENWS